MTKTEALGLFRTVYPRERYIIPSFVSTSGFTLEERRIPEALDVVMRCEDWNNFTDALCKSKRITLRQYESWTNPF